MEVNFVPADLEVNNADNRDVKLSYFIKSEEKRTKAQAIKV